MDNLFKNAYFGKEYKTRDERKAFYHSYRPSSINGMMFHYLMVENEKEFIGYNKNGYRGLGGEQGIDIVSEC